MTGPGNEDAPADPLGAIEAAFANFLENNKKSKIAGPLSDQNSASIMEPWGDESFAINVPTDYETLAEALNNTHLPERFSALWHRDTRRLEFIWTAFPLSATWKDVPGRTFTFRFREHDHICEFGDSSPRLLEIARNFSPVKGGTSDYRNLASYRVHLDKPEGMPSIETHPRSFWVSNLDWDEDYAVALANNLNFYLTYYDAISPYIVIHAPRDNANTKQQTRYPLGSVPTEIDGREIDDILLELWQAARGGDSAVRFLFYFRIIEFASFTYLETKARQEIRKILAAPHARSNLISVTEDVVDALQRSKQEDFTKCESLLRETVKPTILWREISLNKAAFSKPTKLTEISRLDL